MLLLSAMATSALRLVAKSTFSVGAAGAYNILEKLRE